MRILHTESSNGWGGQEIRIFREAEGFREKGHEVIIATARGGGLAAKAQAAGFTVYELNWKKSRALWTWLKLLQIIYRHRIEVVNTHSSWDAWVGGIAAKTAGKKVVRTRHLSSRIRAGLNSWLLYKQLADQVVTTSSAIIPQICAQAGRSPSTVRCIPTGLDPLRLEEALPQREAFRLRLGLESQDVLVGMVCILRSWKGIPDFLAAARMLKREAHLKWVLVGGGHLQDYEPLLDKWDLRQTVRFLGHLDPPYVAMAALDIFALLSTGHEGISQATLQAAYLQKPLITTPVGGLPEVCLDRVTGLIVPAHSPEKVADAVLELSKNPSFRYALGQQGRKLVLEKFTWQQTLSQMEQVYER